MSVNLLTDPGATVPPVPADVPPGGVAWLRATVARFSNGNDHARRRSLAMRELASISVEALRDKAYRRTRDVLGEDTAVVDVMAAIARAVPVGVLAGELGLPDVSADVAVVAPAYHPHVTPDAAAEAALARLIAACGGVADAVLRTDQPVLRTRRRVDGEDVVVDLAGLPFGAGPKECPGRAHAVALAAGVLDALRGFRLVEREISYEPAVNLHVPVRLRVTRGNSVGGLC